MGVNIKHRVRGLLFFLLLALTNCYGESAFELGERLSQRTGMTEDEWEQGCIDIIEKYMGEISAYLEGLIAHGLSTKKIRNHMESIRTDLAKLESEASTTSMKLQRRERGRRVLDKLKGFWSTLSARIDKAAR